jgi:hypothetical protein
MLPRHHEFRPYSVDIGVRPDERWRKELAAILRAGRHTGVTSSRPLVTGSQKARPSTGTRITADQLTFVSKSSVPIDASCLDKSRRWAMRHRRSWDRRSARLSAIQAGCIISHSTITRRLQRRPYERTNRSRGAASPAPFLHTGAEVRKERCSRDASAMRRRRDALGLRAKACPSLRTNRVSRCGICNVPGSRSRMLGRATSWTSRPPDDNSHQFAIRADENGLVEAERSKRRDEWTNAHVPLVRYVILLSYL